MMDRVIFVIFFGPGGIFFIVKDGHVLFFKKGEVIYSSPFVTFFYFDLSSISWTSWSSCTFVMGLLTVKSGNASLQRGQEVHE